MLRSYLAYAIQANKVFTTVFKLDTVFLQRLVEPVLFVLTLVSQCLTSHESKQTLILAKTLTSDPYKPGLLKTRQSVRKLKLSINTKPEPILCEKKPIKNVFLFYYF